MKQIETKTPKRLILFAVFLLFATALYHQTAYASKALDDNKIRDAVEDQIILDIGVDLNSIDVIVTDGIVTLFGTAGNILEKERTAKIAQMVKGVRSVINNTKVVSSVLRSDKDIQADVKNALLWDPATEAYEVDVAVDDKTVTLTGKVQSWQERMLSEKVAKGVKGVRDVVNQIDVNFTMNRSDIEIEKEIERAMRWNILLDHMLVDVQVEEGIVKLNGTVGSAAEKNEAYITAHVAGVQSVDDTGLQVKKWARDKDMRKNKYAIKSNEAVEEAVKDAFLYDPRVSSTNIAVTADKGVVTLRGSVDNLIAKRSAAQDARNTVGVFRVKNRIKVEPAVLLINDDKIAESIRKSLMLDPIVERYEVTVDVTGGIAKLYGTVDSYYEKAQADIIASQAKGVLAVDNNLNVSQSHRAYTYDPYLDYWNVNGYTWYTYQPGIPLNSDEMIEEEIEDQFFWSPFVDSDSVDVEVENGVAIITGEVDSWSDFYAAQKNAMDGGAVSVRNKLEVSSTSG